MDVFVNGNEDLVEDELWNVFESGKGQQNSVTSAVNANLGVSPQLKESNKVYKSLSLGGRADECDSGNVIDITALIGEYAQTRLDETPMWQLDALCAKVDPELFFPDKGGSTRDAKRVCGECTVKGQCLAFAIENDQRFGIWGGTSERERRSIRRKLKKIVAFEPIPYTKVNASGG